ncbi:MraY family glycosyltransferase [Marinobacterium aestuariivivens]|uniref:Glycosyltransferase family 4 protein n=1 Tax=Marinobacterium aestuariivivens TaxID=1698799 RepID=A0ABW1ZX19_9GAMM
MVEAGGMLGLLAGAAVLAALLTGALRRYALAGGMLDVPNARSSHMLPTPRGGGVSVVLVYLAGLCLLFSQGLMADEVLIGLVGAGVLVALIGWVDDRQSVAARWRLAVHFLAAGWGLFWLGGLPPVVIYAVEFDLGWLGHGLALLYLVWLLNLYNFMDGIDGIAGVEAVTVALGGCLLAVMAGAGVEAWWPMLLLAAGVAGFLVWNWPPARIFMGDAGSGFIGLMLGLLSIQAAYQSFELLAGWLVLLAVFVTDATLTLIRRLLRGMPLAEAHRSHGYQYAARRLGSHRG